MQRLFARTIVLTALLGLVLMLVSGTALAQYYKLTNLTSNQSGKAKHQDPLLINAWGMAYAPNEPFWVSDEGDGWSTIYDGKGNPQSLQVIVPSASGSGSGSPTGLVYNGSQEFQIESWPSEFIFSTLDGTIQGWSHFSPSASIIAVNNSGKNASYNALAVTSKTSGNSLFVPDFNNNVIDIYDGNFNFVKSFTDSKIPKGFVPFGIQDIKGKVYVAYAAANEGPGGYIDIFDESGNLMKRFAHGKPLNQPWGFAVAPKNFGPLSGTLLVSNNTDHGTINGFDLKTGKFVGTITNSKGKAIKIDQLWAIEFGGGSANNGNKDDLYFTAGPNNNLDGTFGVIKFVK